VPVTRHCTFSATLLKNVGPSPFASAVKICLTCSAETILFFGFCTLVSCGMWQGDDAEHGNRNEDGGGLANQGRELDHEGRSQVKRQIFVSMAMDGWSLLH
jgi:hypothetical protein